MLITDKVPLILFSGGIDSTYLLYEALRKYAEVRVISARLSLQSEKTVRESAARELIFNEFQQLRHEGEPLGEVIRWSATIHDGQISHNALCQPLHWITLATAYSHITTHEVQIGYLSSDGPYTDNENLQALWKAACAVSGLTGYAGQVPDLVFPISHMSKADVIKALPARLLRMTTWCESSQERDICSMCLPCRKLEKVILTLDGDNSLDEEKSKIVSAIYRKMTGKWLPSSIKQDEVKEVTC